jgi:hypothetical protein
MIEWEREKLAATGISLAHAPQTHRKQGAICFAASGSIFKDCSHSQTTFVWKRSTVLQGKFFDTDLNGLSDMRKTTCRNADLAMEWWTRDGQNVVNQTLSLLSHGIHIWSIFSLTYIADSGRTNKCVSVSGDGLSGAVLHWRARICFDDWLSKPNYLVFSAVYGSVSYIFVLCT